MGLIIIDQQNCFFVSISSKSYIFELTRKFLHICNNQLGLTRGGSANRCRSTAV